MLRRINLVPREPFHIGLKRRLMACSSLLIILGVVIPLANYLLLQKKLHSFQAEIKRLERDASEVEALSIKANSLRQFIGQLKGKISAYEQDIARLKKKGRAVPDFVGALYEISNAMGGEVRLTHVALGSNEGILQGESKRVEAMPIFLEALKRGIGPISGAELLELSKEERKGATLYRFKVRVLMEAKGRT